MILFRLVIPLSIVGAALLFFHIIWKNRYPSNIDSPSFEEQPYAEIWHRGCALILDTLVISPFILLFAYFYEYVSSSWVILAFFTFILIGYKVYMEGAYGQTIGKMWMGIIVVNKYNKRISMYQSFKRYVIYFLYSLSSIVAIFLVSNYNLVNIFYPFYGDGQFITDHPIEEVTYAFVHVSHIWMLFSKNSQTIHDVIAGTYVRRIDENIEYGFWTYLGISVIFLVAVMFTTKQFL